MGMHISTPTSILIKKRNTATNILTLTTTNTIISMYMSILTGEHQMFTIMSIKVNMVLMTITTLDIRQSPINTSMKRLNRDLCNCTL